METPIQAAPSPDPRPGRMFDSFLKRIDRSSRGYRWFMCIIDGLVICLGIAAALNMAASAKDLGFEEPLSWTNFHGMLLDDIWFWANSLAVLGAAAYFVRKRQLAYERQFPTLRNGPNHRLYMWISLRPRIEPQDISRPIHLPNYRPITTRASRYVVVYCILVLLFTAYTTYLVFVDEVHPVAMPYFLGANGAMITVALAMCAAPYVLRAIRRAFFTKYEIAFGDRHVKVRQRIGCGRSEQWNAPYSEFSCVLRSEYVRWEYWGNRSPRPVVYSFIELRHPDERKSLVLWINNYGDKGPRNWILRIPGLYPAPWDRLDQQALVTRWQEFARRFDLPATSLPAVS